MEFTLHFCKSPDTSLHLRWNTDLEEVMVSRKKAVVLLSEKGKDKSSVTVPLVVTTSMILKCLLLVA